MVSIFKGITQAVESLYDSKLTVYRNVETVTPSGAIREKRTQIGEERPCRLSLLTLANTEVLNRDVDVQARRYDVKLFTSSEADISAGDILSVSQRGRDPVIYRAVRDPFLYVSHQEVYIERGDFL